LDTLALAAYGAVVASLAILVSGASLGWQIYTWRRDRNTSVQVELYQRGGRVTIRATNDSQHQIRIRRVELQRQYGSGEVLKQTTIRKGARIPDWVQPHDSGETWWLESELEEAKFDLREPLVARVVAGNTRFQSEPVTIQPRHHVSR
jgi:hypothetical protein